MADFLIVPFSREIIVNFIRNDGLGIERFSDDLDSLLVTFASAKTDVIFEISNSERQF